MWKTYGKFSYTDMQEAVQEHVETAVEMAPSELAQPRWSVISFERCEAASLSYPEAQAQLEELDRRGVTGLCIVSDEAAARIKP